MEKIVVDPESRRILIERYGRVNVCKALSFMTNSLMAKEIRHEAMNEFKGVLFKF